MSLTAYEARTLPSVFSDVHTRSEVQAAKEEVQQARRRAGRMWIYVLVILGILIAVAIAAYVAWTQLQQANADRRNLAQQNSELAQQQEDLRAITGRRAELLQMRETLRETIDTMGRNPANGTRWRDTLDRVAKQTWVAQVRTCGAACNGWPTFVYPGPSQSWDITQRQAADAMDREIAMMREVTRQVDNAATRLRSGGTVTVPVTPGCENPLNCPQ